MKTWSEVIPGWTPFFAGVKYFFTVNVKHTFPDKSLAIQFWKDGQKTMRIIFTESMGHRFFKSLSFVSEYYVNKVLCAFA